VDSAGEARGVVTWSDLGSDLFGGAAPAGAGAPQPHLGHAPDLAEVAASSMAATISSAWPAPTSPLAWSSPAVQTWCPASPLAALTPTSSPFFGAGAVSTRASPLSTVPAAAPAPWGGPDAGAAQRWSAGQSPTHAAGGAQIMAAQMAEVMRHMQQEIYED